MNLTQTLGIALGIIGFLFLITIHEGGHFLVSKALGVRVNEFSVGMGPLIAQKEKNGTMYSFRALPIGGYCALEGEFADDATEEEIENFVDEDPRAFVNQPLWKQALVLVAGSAVNFIFGFILIYIVYLVLTEGRLSVISAAWRECMEMSGSIFTFLGGLFNGSCSVQDVSGVVGIISIVAETASYGLINVFYLIALLSVNLSVMNMLPIPGLDGGRLFVLIVKTLSGGRLSGKAENIINGIGMVFLLLLIFLVAIKDVVVLFR